jgi:hypothetical protein
MFIIGTDIAVERQAGGFGGSLGHGQRHAQDAIGAEPRLVRRAVQFNHGAVDGDLVFGLHAGKAIENLAVDGGHGFGNALAHVAALVAVAQFRSIMGAR